MHWWYQPASSGHSNFQSHKPHLQLKINNNSSIKQIEGKAHWAASRLVLWVQNMHDFPTPGPNWSWPRPPRLLARLLLLSVTCISRFLPKAQGQTWWPGGLVVYGPPSAMGNAAESKDRDGRVEKAGQPRGTLGTGDRGQWRHRHPGGALELGRKGKRMKLVARERSVKWPFHALEQTRQRAANPGHANRPSLAPSPAKNVPETAGRNPEPNMQTTET